MNAWTIFLVAVLAAAVSNATTTTTAPKTTAPTTTTKPTTKTPTTKPTTKPPTTKTTAAPTKKTTTTPAPTTTTPTKKTTTTPAPTTKNTTTPAPTTTTPAPTTKNTTTPAPTTLAPTPKKNTTVSPTKHNTTLAPTTLAPTKPPTAKPTTMPIPVPEYSVTTKDKKPCITLKADIAVNFKNTSSKLPANAKDVEVAGDCLNNTTPGFINLSWKSSQTNGVVVLTSFQMDFAEAKDQWMATNMSYSLTIGKGAPLRGFLQKDQNLKSFQASLTKSYKCDRSEIVNMEHGVSINIQHLRVQPLPLNDGTKFFNDTMCPATPDVTPTSSIVPIAVGCALAGLIVIVLIAYLVGRRKSSRGYQQV